MPTKIKEVQTPHGLARLLFRLPIWLFRLHLGWLAGHCFLLLTHSGRQSGLPRQTVLTGAAIRKSQRYLCYAV